MQYHAISVQFGAKCNILGVKKTIFVNNCQLWKQMNYEIGFSFLHKISRLFFREITFIFDFLRNQQFLDPLFNQSFCSLFINEITSFKVQNYVEKNGGKALQVEEWRKLYNLSLDLGNDLAQSSVVKTLVG